MSAPVETPKRLWAVAHRPFDECAVDLRADVSEEEIRTFAAEEAACGVVVGQATEFVDATEVVRLRAALESIAALQTEAPADTSEETGERFDSLRDAYECGEMDGYRAGQWEASSLATKALVSK